MTINESTLSGVPPRIIKLMQAAQNHSADFCRVIGSPETCMAEAIARFANEFIETGVSEYSAEFPTLIGTDGPLDASNQQNVQAAEKVVVSFKVSVRRLTDG